MPNEMSQIPKRKREKTNTEPLFSNITFLSFTTCRDVPLTLARAFGKMPRPASPNVEGIWETICQRFVIFEPIVKNRWVQILSKYRNLSLEMLNNNLTFRVFA